MENAWQAAEAQHQLYLLKHGNWIYFPKLNRLQYQSGLHKSEKEHLQELRSMITNAPEEENVDNMVKKLKR